MSHHTRGRKAEPKPVGNALKKVPAPPKDMTAEAKKEWKRVMPVLVERGVLSQADMAAAEMYCNAVGDIAIARARIKLDGDYIENRLGELKRHPAFTTLREATAEARRWAAEIGCTPAARSRVSAGEGDDDSTASKMDL